MTGTIKVSPEKLLSTAQEFSSQGSTISALTSQMLNLVTTLSSAWEGDAATAYITKLKSLESDIQVMNRIQSSQTQTTPRRSPPESFLKNNKKLSRKSLRDSIIRYKTTDR